MMNALRVQVAFADVTIDRTEIGLFANFALPSEAPRCPVPRAILDDVQLTIRDRDNPTLCILFVKDGVLEVLECYDAADEDWPEFPQIVKVEYLLYHPEPVRPGVDEEMRYTAEPIPARDLDGLKRMWTE